MDCGRGHWGAPGEAGGAAGPNWLMGAPGVEGVLTGSLVREETGATSVGALLLLLLLLLFTVLLCWLLLLLLLLLLFTTTCKAPGCQGCCGGQLTVTAILHLRRPLQPSLCALCLSQGM